MNGDDTVVITKSATESIYHTNENCPSLENCANPKTVNYNRVSSYRQCKRCKHGEEICRKQNGQQGGVCSNCGEEYSKFAWHVPECDGL